MKQSCKILRSFTLIWLIHAAALACSHEATESSPKGDVEVDQLKFTIDRNPFNISSESLIPKYKRTVIAHQILARATISQTGEVIFETSRPLIEYSNQQAPSDTFAQDFDHPMIGSLEAGPMIFPDLEAPISVTVHETRADAENSLEDLWLSLETTSAAQDLIATDSIEKFYNILDRDISDHNDVTIRMANTHHAAIAKGMSQPKDQIQSLRSTHGKRIVYMKKIADLALSQLNEAIDDDELRKSRVEFYKKLAPLFPVLTVMLNEGHLEEVIFLCEVITGAIDVGYSTSARTGWAKDAFETISMMDYKTGTALSQNRHQEALSKLVRARVDYRIVSPVEASSALETLFSLDIFSDQHRASLAAVKASLN